MLELPEVEVLRKDLEKEVVGKRVKDSEVRDDRVVQPYHRSSDEFRTLLEGRKIEAVRRRGTVLFLDLDEDMTWIVQPSASSSLHRDTTTETAGPDTEMLVTLNAGGAIHVTGSSAEETSRTGVLPTPDALAEAGISETALDPVEDSPTWLQFAERLRLAAAPLKAFLMDSTYVLGIGTVYSDEALFEAGLAYDRRSDTLSTQEVRRLYRAIQEVMQAAIKQRGATLDEPASDEGFEDDSEPVGHLRVYGREGQACLRCRRTIVKTRLKGKQVTYHCERCQI